MKMKTGCLISFSHYYLFFGLIFFSLKSLMVMLMSLTLLIISSVLHTPTRILSKMSLCKSTTGKNNSIRRGELLEDVSAGLM